MSKGNLYISSGPRSSLPKPPSQVPGARETAPYSELSSLPQPLSLWVPRNSSQGAQTHLGQGEEAGTILSLRSFTLFAPLPPKVARASVIGVNRVKSFPQDGVGVAVAFNSSKIFWVRGSVLSPN